MLNKIENEIIKKIIVFQMFKTNFDNTLNIKEEYKKKVDEIILLYEVKVVSHLNKYEKK